MSEEPEKGDEPVDVAEGATPRPEATPSTHDGPNSEPWRAYLDLTHTVGTARASDAPRRSFEDGQLLAGRFRIVGFIASGGMGEVYEAEDQVLRERVALKTIRQDLAAERDAERFRREIQLARKVTHPNVCRIYDIFEHRDETSGRSLAFLSMELLAGETLGQHLARRGRIAAGDALPLLRQMAAALDAAHGRGVVHRDFKPGNVMLVPQPPHSVPRAAVTDFGLALSSSLEEGGSGSSSLSGRIVGTPAYMAPEQVKGARVGPAADVYALGVVAYEMVTGRPPFVGENSLSTATQRLEGPPPPPSRFFPGIDQRWERAILRCLEREPAARFEHAGDFCRALELPGAARRWRSWLGWAALVAVVALGAWHAGRRVMPGNAGGARPASAALASSRRAVAVLGFRNLSARPEQAWLSTALSEMLASELSGGGQLRLVPGESVARAQGDLQLGGGAESLARESLGRLRVALAADLVVAGSYFAPGEPAGGRVRLDLRVQDTGTGETVHSLIENGTEAELPELVARCGQRLRGALGLADSPSGEGNLPGIFGRDARATRLYSEGLALLRQHEAVAARDKLLEATRVAPGQPLAYSALADAWALLGYQDQARASAQKALDLAVGLSREQRLQVEGRLREHAFDWTAAARTYRSLFEFFPDNVEYGLKLAEALSRGGRGREALEVVAGLRHLPPPESDDPRIDLAEARAARALSDLTLSEKSAETAARKGLARGARLIAAAARLEQSWAHFLKGEGGLAKRAAGEARRLFEETGDRSGVADAAQLTAHVLWMQEGDFGAAVRIYEEAVEAYRASGNHRGLAQALVNLAGPLAEQGDLTSARRLCEEALPLFRETSARVDEVATLANLSGLHVRAGDLAAAGRRAQESLEVARRVGSPSAEAHALEATGRVLFLKARFDEAKGPLERALAIRAETGERVAGAGGELVLAAIDLEQGRSDAAAARAERVAREMAAAQQPEQEASARALLARASLAAGRPEPARAAAQAAEKLAPGLGRQSRLEIEVAAALVEAAGDRARGLARLRAALLDARAAGSFDLQLEVRRALAGLGGEDPAGLAREARRSGYLLYARPPSK